MNMNTVELFTISHWDMDGYFQQSVYCRACATVDGESSVDPAWTVHTGPHNDCDCCAGLDDDGNIIIQ